jgi:glycerol uptake facilitator-like aquaporin
MNRSTYAEFGGAVLLLYVVVGSGTVVERLGAEPSDGLFYHAVMVGAGLAVLIAVFGPVSGAHLNPAVTLAVWRRSQMDAVTALRYLIAQMAGAVAGVALASLTFSGRPWSLATTERVGWGPLVAEYVGTMVLVLLILTLTDQRREDWVPITAGAWVATMVFSSASSGFLNPAVTLGRVLTDSYTGIDPLSVPGFLAAQTLGGLTAVLVSPSAKPLATTKGT